MIYFILGVILGVLIRDIKFKALDYLERLEKLKETIQEKQEHTTFLEPVTPEEKWNKAQNISDLLDNK